MGAVHGEVMSADLSYKERLLAKIASKQAVVGVVGLGYVGLPLALLFEEAPGVLESSLEPQ